MSRNPDDLLEIASTVGDGAPLEWSVLQTAGVPVGDPALLRELQIIARIAEAHRAASRDEAGALEAGETRRWGHLVVKERLGAGSFGTVYRAHDTRLERDVALKLYRAAAPHDQPLNSLFSEGRLLARVRHPNVVAVHGVEQHGDEVGLWLELVDGRTLADEVRSAGPLGFREAALVGQDVCRALAAVHQAGLVHRDVKAQNVMRERGGRVVLMDFGIGRALDARAPGPEMGGTPLYMAPELFNGGGATVASDIYSVGVLLFFLVTGSYPVLASDRAGLERSHRDHQRRLLRDVRPDLPDAFVEVIERACAADPADRFATTGAMQAALAGVIGLSSVKSGETTSRTARAHKILTFGPGWLALAAGVLIVVIGFLWRGSAAPTTASAPSAATPSSAATGTRISGAAPLVDPDRYQIQAAFHRASASGNETLASGARVAPGDRLFVEIEATRPVHVYIVNQDERGESYLLFPLPGQQVSNPLPPGAAHRLPGGALDEVYWQVTSAGGREHFLVVASPEPLGALEAVFAKLPKPEAGRPVSTAAHLSNDVVGQLRGIGGLASRPSAATPTSDFLRSAVALTPGLDSVKGPWMRQFTLENPGK